jgi:hypothetical protein
MKVKKEKTFECLGVQDEKKIRTNYKLFKDIGYKQKLRIIKSIKDYIGNLKKFGFQSSRVDLVSTEETLDTEINIQGHTQIRATNVQAREYGMNDDTLFSE